MNIPEEGLPPGQVAVKICAVLKKCHGLRMAEGHGAEDDRHVWSEERRGPRKLGPVTLKG
jgi:hypothetical protein